MSKRTVSLAEIQCKNDKLREIYKRQFRELESLRKYIYSQLPFAQINSIFEPGCGTGLLGKELQTLTNAVYTGVDIDYDILPVAHEFVCVDAEKEPLSADIYMTSFFFSSLKNPLKWLKKVRKKLPKDGLFVVFAEYDYSRIGELPDMGIAEALRVGLESDGISTIHGSRLDSLFKDAGFIKVVGNEVENSFQIPDRAFLEMHIKDVPALLPEMLWRIVWGIWRLK